MSWKNFLIGSVLSLFAMSASAQEAPAADPGPPMGISLLTVNLNPGGAAAFTQFMTKWVEAANKINYAGHWSATARAAGGPDNIGFARPFWSFAELGDQTAPLVEAFGQDEAMKLGKSISGSVASTQTEIYIMRPDLSRPAPPSKDPVVAMLVLQIDIKPGMQVAYENYVKKIVEASNKTNQANWIGLSGGPGSAHDYIVGIPYTSWAAMDTQPMSILKRLTTAFGEAEGQKISAAGAAAIENINTVLRRSRPDISRPMPQ